MFSYYGNNCCADGEGKVIERHEKWEVCQGDEKNGTGVSGINRVFQELPRE